MKKGRVRGHVMPEFSKTRITKPSDNDVWLRSFPMGPELLMYTVFGGVPTQTEEWTRKGVDFADLKLRLEHTHFYGLSEKTKEHGGHYHGDILPPGPRHLDYLTKNNPNGNWNDYEDVE